MMTLRALALEIVRARYAVEDVHFVTTGVDPAFDHLAPMCGAGVHRVMDAHPRDVRMRKMLACLEASGVMAVRVNTRAIFRACARFGARPVIARGGSSWAPNFETFDPSVHHILNVPDPVLRVLETQNIFAAVPRVSRKSRMRPPCRSPKFTTVVPATA